MALLGGKGLNMGTKVADKFEIFVHTIRRRPVFYNLQTMPVIVLCSEGQSIYKMNILNILTMRYDWPPV